MADSTVAPPHPHLLTRWLCQYNPFFTLSALLVLGGVWLLSGELGADAVLQLTVVLEAYQALLLGTAWYLLRRRGQRRPAVILGIITVVIMADPTLQLSAAAAAGDSATSLLWVAAFTVKLPVLLNIFRLRLQVGGWVMALTGVLCAALAPHLIMRQGSGIGAAQLMWVMAFGLSFLAARCPPSLTSTAALTGFPAQVLTRCAAAAAGLSVSSLAYHLAPSVSGSAVTTWGPVVGMVFLGSLHRGLPEGALFTRVMAALLLCLPGGHAALVVTLLLGALAVLSLAPGYGVPARLLAVALGYAGHLMAMSGGGPLLSALPWCVLLMALTGRAAPAVSAAGVTALAGHAAWRADLWHPPTTSVQWGVMLLSSGFILLPAGVWVHQRLQRHLATVDATAESHPVSPAAIPSAHPS